MKKVSKQTRQMEAVVDKPTMTMGLDMGDRFSPSRLIGAPQG